MQLEKYDKLKHYDTLAKWCEAQNWPCLPADFYSGTGFMAYKEDKPIAVGFLITADHYPLGFLEWMIGDPEADWHDRRDGINMIIDACVDAAKKDNCQFVMTMTKNKRLIEKYKENNFMETDTDMTHLVRRI